MFRTEVKSLALQQFVNLLSLSGQFKPRNMADDAKLASLAKANAVLAEHFTRDATQIPDPGEVILRGK